MLVNTKEVLLDAERNNYAVAAFSVYNWETIKAAISAAEKMKCPVILALGERYLNYIEIEVFANIVKMMVGKVKVPICLHLDHAYNKTSIISAIKHGFTSVMYDGSQFSFEENVQKTKEIVELSHQTGVSVEAELGSIAKGEHSDEEEGDNILTDPMQAVKFIELTNIDFLAPAIGTVHGLYVGEPEIDLHRLQSIHNLTSLPLVLHGGSGTPEKLLIETINRGIRKININTEISIAAVTSIQNQLDFSVEEKRIPHHSLLNERMQMEMMSVMEKYIQLFSNQSKTVFVS